MSSPLPQPRTFREGEVLGLRLMQDGRHDEALKGELLASNVPNIISLICMMYFATK